MNKLLFRLERDFDDNIIFVANNHKDLEDYLRDNYNWYKFTIKEYCVSIQECVGYEFEIATLEWVKHI